VTSHERPDAEPRHQNAGPDAPRSTSPLARFHDWYAGAVAAGVLEPEAMALATATPGGAPSVRFVLLKGVDARGVLFYTNYESRKGRELAANPRAALAVLWKPLQRQVRLEGAVERLSDEENDAYFATRSRGSRLGAWASAQSTEIPDREYLDARLAAADERYPDDVPRPPYWGGYRLVPDLIEFWEGRPNRLHDREELRLVANTWRSRRLSP
jgi:pyridoxamine 5'-phosphate oxidase